MRFFYLSAIRLYVTQPNVCYGVRSNRLTVNSMTAIKQVKRLFRPLQHLLPIYV